MFPIPGFREDFPCTVYKRTVGVGITLKPVHKPRRGITKVAIDSVHTGWHSGQAIGLAGYIVVIGTDERTFQLGNASRDSIVIGLNRLEAGDAGRLIRRRNEDVRRTIDEEHGTGRQVVGVKTIRTERTPHVSR